MIHIHIFYCALFNRLCSPLFILSFSFIKISDSLYYHGLVIYYYYIYCIYFLDLSVSMFVSLRPGFRMGIHVVFNLVGSLRKYWKFLNAIRDIYIYNISKLPFISKKDPKCIDISLYFHTKKTISASNAIHSWQIH